jgi:hypothetical protein
MRVPLTKSLRFQSGTPVERKLRLFGLVVAAALLLATGESRACPHGNQARHDAETVAAVVHKPAATMVVAASVSPSLGANRAAAIDCCWQCSGSACASGHCPACALALLAFAPQWILEDAPAIYGLPVQTSLRHTKPPPEFRPPRASA